MLDLTTLRAAWTPRLLSVLRIIAALLLLQHGTAKMLGFPHVPSFDHLSPLIATAGAIELIGGLLLLVGLFSVPVAFILSGEMAFVYFIGHFPRGFYPLLNGGNLPILWCFVFLYLSAAGPGPWSIDAARK